MLDVGLMATGEGCVVVIGLCGASNGGKTTLAKKLQERYPCSATVIHQDDFYKDDDEVPVSEDGQDCSWDMVEAIDMGKLVTSVRLATSQAIPGCGTTGSLPQNHIVSTPPCLRHLVIVEGTMLLNCRELRPLFNAAYFLTLDQDTMRERRSSRKYDGKIDSADYFDKYLWPSYLRDLKMACSAHHDGSVRMLDGCKSCAENLQEIEARITEIIESRTAAS